MDDKINAAEILSENFELDTSEQVFSGSSSCDESENTYDERYETKELNAAYDLVISADRLLSKELGDKRFQVHLPEQQVKWGVLKWNAQKELAQLMFEFRTPWLYLKSDLGSTDIIGIADLPKVELLDDYLDASDDSDMSSDKDSVVKINRKKKLVGLAIMNEQSGLRVDFEPSNETYAMLVQLIDQHLTGSGAWTKREFVEMLTEEYHLSYCHFIRGHAARLMNAISALKSSTSTEQEQFAQLEGITWNMCLNLNRLMTAQNCVIFHNRNRLVETNMRSAVKAASLRYRQSGMSKPCLERLDLVTEAAMGLMHAADLYIPKCAAKFTTYATSWMKQRTSRYIKNNNQVRMPLHISEQYISVTSTMTVMIQMNPQYTHEHLPSRRDVEEVLSKKRGRKVTISSPVWDLSIAKMRGQSICVGGLDLNGGYEIPGDSYSCEENELADSARDMKILVDKLFSSDKLSEVQKKILRYTIMDTDSIEDPQAYFGLSRDKLRTERNKAMKIAEGVLKEFSGDISKYFSDSFVGNNPIKSLR